MKGIMEIMRIEKLYFDELNKIIQEYNQEYETVLASMTKEERCIEREQKRKEANQICETVKKRAEKVERIVDQNKVRKFEKLIPKVLKMAEVSCVNVVAETTDTLEGHIRLSTTFFHIFQEHRTTFSEMLISAKDVSFSVKNNLMEMEFWYDLYIEREKIESDT